MATKKKTAGLVRQGDVLLVPCGKPAAKDMTPAPADPRGLVLAEGETSGHHHAIFGNGAKLMHYKQTPGRVVVVVGKDGADMRVVGGGSGGVDRHAPIALVAGHYEVRIQRSYSAGYSRKVAD
jgi:hypothetical protein